MTRRYSGFSLIEILMAIGTLSIGMIFIGGTFLVAIHFTGVSADQTTAAIVANEAFAKIKIFGVAMRVGDPNLGINYSNRYKFEIPTLSPFAYNEFEYPSTVTRTGKKYFWSALCRLDPNDPLRDLQVTVFVSRKVGGPATRYPYRHPTDPSRITIDWPVVMPVGVIGTVGSNILTIQDDPATPFDETRWIGPGYTIVENSTGDIYRVVDHGGTPTLAQIILDRPWDPRGIYPDPDVVWVVPPPIGRGKGPCIEVYQEIITF